MEILGAILGGVIAIKAVWVLQYLTRRWLRGLPLIELRPDETPTKAKEEIRNLTGF